MKSIYRNAILKSLRKAQLGSISVSLPDGLQLHCGESGVLPQAKLDILDEGFFREIAHKGGIGLGEAYQRGYWKTDRLATLLQWLLINHSYIAPNVSPFLASLARKAYAGLDAIDRFRKRNSIEGSRENIHAHYDLGNDFYREFLDPSLTYSAAYFSEPGMDLEAAQTEKYDRLCRKLELGPMNHVLEIGCGWGGFAVHAAKHYDCCVTATTISYEQYAYAKQRVIREGLEDRIHVTMTDYRKLNGTFDRIASIEMLEAVGQEFLPEYFERLDELLEPNGLAAVQVITCPNPLYDAFSGRVDWIQKHIFPGSHLPSTHALVENAEKRGKLDLYHLESFGLHYAETLKQWRVRFMDRWSRIKQIGFDEAFKRKWEYYLAYCEAGFLQRHINVCQLVFGRADETTYRFETPRTEMVAEPELIQERIAQ